MSTTTAELTAYVRSLDEAGRDALREILDEMNTDPLGGWDDTPPPGLLEAAQELVAGFRLEGETLVGAVRRLKGTLGLKGTQGDG